MRRNEVTIGLSVAALGAIVAFWLLVLAPKRQEASALKTDVDQLNSELAEAQQSAAAGQEARASFPGDYRKLVVLGKAVPVDGDQASLLVQIQQLANESGVSFQSIDLSDVTASAASTSSTPPPTSSSSEESSTPASSTTSSSPSSTTADSSASATSSTASTAEVASVATEATAAALPIGASVGPAGLPVMPYELTFTGNYFQIASFMKKLNGLVHLRRGALDVTGRLVTVDAFALAPVQSEGQGLTPVPTLSASLSVTTYLTPAEQGLTAGATPTGPAPPTTTPASTTTGTASSGTAASPTSTSAAASTASAPTTSP